MELVIAVVFKWIHHQWIQVRPYQLPTVRLNLLLKNFYYIFKLLIKYYVFYDGDVFKLSIYGDV